MDKQFFTIGIELSIDDLAYMEDFVLEYLDQSVVDQALEGIPEKDIDRVYNEFLTHEFLRESIFRGRLEYEDIDDLIDEMYG